MGFTYVVADIHGCAEEYFALLEKIHFSPEDELFVLGDAMDRGPEPIKVIESLMQRENVYYILGNHDAMFLEVLRRLMVELSEENTNALTGEDFLAYFDYVQNGGEETLRQFRRLPPHRQADICDYLASSPAYETIEHDGNLYILTHAGIDNFDSGKELDEYELKDFLWGRPDYERKYFPGNRIFLVTGHTPTSTIRKDKCPLVYRDYNHIAIDCGCVFGGNLAAYCVETGAATYVASRNRKNRGPAFAMC